jgi:cytochrome c5
MTHVLRTIGLVLILAASGAVLSAQRGGATLPPGDGRDLVAVACSQCHGLGTIASMRDGAAGWKVYVYDMILRGAQLNPSEADTVLQYLVKNLGPGAPAPGAMVVTLPNGPGKEIVEGRCTACHDLGRVTTARRDKSDWELVVHDMVTRGAKITPEEVQAVTSYLVAQFGTR